MASVNNSLRHLILIFAHILTVVICGVLVGGAGVLYEGEVGQHLPALAKVHESAQGEERHLGDHGEDLVGGRVDGQDHNPAPGSPLPQILNQEESVEDVHTVSGLKRLLLRV